jgi:hypothetical protein
MDAFTSLDNCETGLNLPGSCLVVGATGSGKSLLVAHLLEQDCFSPRPAYVDIYFAEFQAQYAKLQSTLQARGVQVQLHQGSEVRLSDYPQLTLDQGDSASAQRIILIDDAGQSIASNTDIAKVVTQGRHRGLSLIATLHSLFYGSQANLRLISANVSYFLLLPSLRLQGQVQILDRQLQMQGRLYDAFLSVCEEGRTEANGGFAYLLLDVTNECSKLLRIRTNLTSQAAVVAYV